MIAPATVDDRDVLIDVRELRKKFCRRLRSSLWQGLQDVVLESVGRRSNTDVLRHDEFWAVDDVSFQLRRGDCLALMGHNGAGKTTLLRVLNGLVKPDGGSVHIRGRLAALVALGAGFDPVLTGRENVYVNGAVLGMSTEETNQHFDEILEFSEVGDFIDAPVRSYSSGMKVRLGFAVATALQPDILLVDEVLAVGDFAFRQKCMRRMNRFRAEGGSIILVSHNTAQLQSVCNRAVLLDRGRIQFDGPIFQATNRYFEATLKRLENRDNNQNPDRLDESEQVRITGLSVLRHHAANTVDDEATTPVSGGRTQFAILVDSSIDPCEVFLRLVLMDQEMGLRLATLSSELAGGHFVLAKGENRLSVTVKSLTLAPGRYAVRATLRRSHDDLALCRRGFDDPPFYFTVALADKESKSLANHHGDLMVLELESSDATGNEALSENQELEVEEKR
ncbi:MAG: ABC transporter ATP-binding protein [Planctomycetota bacterium]